MPLTASNTAAWTMADMRVITSGLVPATSPARNVIWFQSTTTSAYAAEPAGVTKTSTKHSILMNFITLPLSHGHAANQVAGLSPPHVLLCLPLHPPRTIEAGKRSDNWHTKRRTVDRARRRVEDERAVFEKMIGNMQEVKARGG